MSHKILLVEDEELLSSAFSMILEKDGHTVKVASNGKEALKIIPEFKPELIFLDLLMPEMGGVEFLKNYKPVGKQTPPIVVLSNLHDQEIIEQVHNLGAVEYVVKSQITSAEMSKLASGLLA